MLSVGVDIGGTKVAIGVVDQHGQIVEKRLFATNLEDPASIAQGIASHCTDLAQVYDISGIGIASAGFVNADRKTIDFSANIPWDMHYPLAARIAEHTHCDVPIVVENDGNAAGWAEFRFGAGQGSSSMLMLTIGTGLGGAIILDHHLVRGSYGMAAEVGHMRLVPGGHYCGCGHEGCWETYASGSALVKRARFAAIAHPSRAGTLLDMAGGKPKKITGPMVTTAAQEGDGLAIELLAELGSWLGQGAASVASLLDIETIVIGGGVCEAGDLLLEPARHAFMKALPAAEARTAARIELAQARNDAGMIGAADLALR